MKHISILIPNGHISLSNVDASHLIFSQVNDFLKMQGQTPMFNIEFVGIQPEVKQTTGRSALYPKTINDIKKTDLILIPAIHDDPLVQTDVNDAFIPWMIKQHENGAEVASMCIGAFLLAKSGLLDGKTCATHWMYVNQFKELYPNAKIQNEKIVTDEGGIMTSGGAFSFLNLLLHIVEKYSGRELAILIAKAFAIELDRESQSAFIIFQGQKSHNDDLVIKAQEFIEENYFDKITIEELADILAIGRRSLERRFKKATHNTLVEYIQRVKIEAAKKSLESTRNNVNEVMYDVGYSDMKAFRNTFKKITGLSPLEYKNKYNRDMAVA